MGLFNHYLTQKNMEITIQIMDRNGQKLLAGSYHLIDSAIEALGNFERHTLKCKWCNEPIANENYCDEVCTQAHANDTAENEATRN